MRSQSASNRAEPGHASHENAAQLVQPLSARLLDEGISSIVAAAAAEGIQISAKTALRWALSGAAGVRLETVKVGGRRLTSRAAVRRFVAAQNVERFVPEVVLTRDAADKVLSAHGLARRGAGK